MNFWLGVKEGLGEVSSHKFRSLLTVSGVVLGVASLMGTMAMTAGMADGFRRTLIQFGGVERVEIVDAPVPEEQEGMEELSPGRTYRDVMALRSSAPLLAAVGAELRVPNGITLRRDSQKFSSQWASGVEETYMELNNYEIGKGRFISPIDQEKRSRVIVIGEGVYKALWGDSGLDPIGAKIMVNAYSFRVIGVFVPYTNPFKNQAVVMPLSTVKEVFAGANVQDGVDLGPTLKVDRLVARVKSMDHFDSALQQISNVLRSTHRGIEDFGFNTREDWAQSIELAIRGISISGGLVAGVTLLAGGVGITNIMLASIKERTREIGVRRAIGARGADVFSQIIIEALVLAVLGGVIGLFFGYGLVELLKTVAKEEQMPVIRPDAVVFSFLAAVAVGFFSGVFPALKAASLKPIEALRYE